MASTETSRPTSSTPLLAELDFSKPIPIRLLVADYPRLPQLTPSMLGRLQELAEANVRDHLQAEIRMRPVGKIPLQELFRHYLPKRQRLDLCRSVIPADDQQARDAIVWALGRAHKEDDRDHLSQMIEGHPLFREPPNPLSQHEIFLRAADFQVHVLRSLHAQTLADGTPLVSDPLFTQAKAWEMLACCQDRGDMILTAHPIASAESGQTLPVALRGGINAGLVAQNPGPLQGVIVFSAYPFLAKAGVLQEGRGAPPEDPVRVMALYLVHELGHLIRRWGHAWEHPLGCLMRPALSLDYEAWFQRVQTYGPCRLPHPRMKAF